MAISTCVLKEKNNLDVIGTQASVHDNRVIKC